jgi:hypothetical protein
MYIAFHWAQIMDPSSLFPWDFQEWWCFNSCRCCAICRKSLEKLWSNIFSANLYSHWYRINNGSSWMIIQTELYKCKRHHMCWPCTQVGHQDCIQGCSRFNRYYGNVSLHGKFLYASSQATTKLKEKTKAMLGVTFGCHSRCPYSVVEHIYHVWALAQIKNSTYCHESLGRP